MNVFPIHKHGFACACVIALCAIGDFQHGNLFNSRAASADSLDGEFTDGLRSRGLYRLAEIDGLSRWRDSRTAPDDRVATAIDLIRTYTDWAVASPSAEREALFAKAHAMRDAARDVVPTHPRTLLIDLQDALAWLAAGEIARIEATGALADAPYAEAKTKLREAVRGLDVAAVQVDKQLREIRLGQRTVGDGGLSADELGGMARHIGVALARALRNQALCYPAGSPDQVNALTRALERLRAPGVLNVGDAIAWRGRVDEIVCQRLLGRRDEAGSLIAAAIAEKPPGEIAGSLAAEHVRLLLDAGALGDALAVADAERDSADLASPQIDFARLEVLLAMRDQAIAAGQGDAEVAARIARQVERIRASHRPAWTRRAEMLVGRAFATTAGAPVEGTTNFDAMRLAAESLYRAGKLDEAIDAFDKAAKIAGANDIDDCIAFQLSAAAIERRLGRIDAAGGRFLAIAAEFSGHRRAEEAHRMAILIAAEKVRAASAQSERLAATNAYEALLQSHVQNWPDGATADEAMFWLGSLREGTRRWADARDAYWRVRPASEHYAAAVENGARSVIELLNDVDLSSAERAALVAGATGFLQPIITGADNAWPDAWSPLQRAIARHLAEIQFRFAPDRAAGAEYARRILAAALARDDGDAAWAADARSLLVEVLLSRNMPEEAVAVLSRIPDERTEALLQVIRNANRIDPPGADMSARGLGDVLLQIIARFEPMRDSLDETTRTDLDAAKAAALAVLGRRGESISLYAALSKANPRNGAIHRAYAELLSRSNDARELETALDAWSHLERGSRPGGEQWFQARIRRCETLVRLGRTDAAEKLLRLTRALHPELGGEENRRAFERVESTIQSE